MGHGHAAIAVSAGYALSVGRDGSVHAWGDVSGHPVGPARDASQGGGAPLPIGSDFFSVAAGDRVSFAIRADGTLLGWGDTTVGQAGVGRAIPFKPVRVVLARRGDAAGRSSAAKASPPR
jgi:alpha-tubulin suppressor-like RCC1 family protein